MASLKSSNDHLDDGEYYFQTIDCHQDAMSILEEVIDEEPGYTVSRYDFCEGVAWQFKFDSTVSADTLFTVESWLRNQGPMKPVSSSVFGNLRYWMERTN